MNDFDAEFLRAGFGDDGIAGETSLFARRAVERVCAWVLRAGAGRIPRRVLAPGQSLRAIGRLPVAAAMAALFFAPFAAAGSRPTPLILETDIGCDVDDVYALALAARSPDVKLLAVVTEIGDVERRSAIARKLLVRMGRGDVPVASGQATALDPASPCNGGWEGKGIVTPGERVAGISALPAAELMAEVVKRSPEPVVIVSVGGLGDTDAFLRRYPELKARVKRLVIMGGCVYPFELEGKPMPPEIETNLHHDVAASLRVLGSGIPVTLVPIEVTVHAKLFAADFARIERGETALDRAVRAATVDWSVRMKAIWRSLGVEHAMDDAVVLLHDPLAVSVISDPGIAVVRPQRIRLEQSGSDIRTVPDDRGELLVDLAVGLDAGRLSRLVVERVVEK